MNRPHYLLSGMRVPAQCVQGPGFNLREKRRRGGREREGGRKGRGGKILLSAHVQGLPGFCSLMLSMTMNSPPLTLMMHLFTQGDYQERHELDVLPDLCEDHGGGLIASSLSCHQGKSGPLWWNPLKLSGIQFDSHSQSGSEAMCRRAIKASSSHLILFLSQKKIPFVATIVI